MSNLILRSKRDLNRAEFAPDLFKQPGHPSPREAHLHGNSPLNRHNVELRTKKISFQRKIGKAGG